MGIDVFLSSGSRSGYSQDIVDLFAKPNDVTHQFRYATKWISDDVLTRVGDGLYDANLKALLCFIDQGTKGTTPIILPVRFAQVEEVREHGTTKSILFKLGDFCKTEDVRAFNTALRAKHPELPGYEDGDIAGKYWIFDDTDVTDNLERTNTLGDWELLIESYYQLPNPVEDLPFYRFEGLWDLETGQGINPLQKNGELVFNLSGNKEYGVSVYHFHPKSDFPNIALKIASDEGLITPLNGNSRVLHTRYDQKDYRFAAKQAMLGANTHLKFLRTESATGKLIWEDFLLRLKIKPSWKLAALYILAIAIGFALPFIVREADDLKNQWAVALAAVVGGVLVGVVTLFKDKIRL